MTAPAILMIYTGGTIGMLPGAGGLAPDPAFADKVAAWLHRRDPSLNVTPRVLEPLIDSAEATSAHWQAIAGVILAEAARFDAFVVLHGTDTMAYTASALSFLLRGLAKPVVLTGAQIPFSADDGDARENLAGAFDWACDGRIREVAIFFDGVLLRGNRSVKFSTAIGDSFASPHWPLLATSRPTIRVIESALLAPSATEAPPAAISAIPPAIGLLKVYPGLSERVLLSVGEAHPGGIVIELYGSGTAPMLSSNLRGALETLARRAVPIVGVSQCARGMVFRPSYASTYMLRDLGVIPGHDLTSESALTKLSYLRQRGVPAAHLATLMATDLAGEVSEDKTQPGAPWALIG